ncbi:60S ribosomal protein L13 [Didymosphaeria variabile]|uniref:60S ribosomal protein L13 n=1 Tax=Didymosphaeria variabile TaxID=1932322 RepID=A0A9W8XI59_9PLEO|nr:60S ribosomal protein L13 [Didymosphaeria variabile]KAJ4350132.1 60S ribosomal protein L13 [Didymosphaeria variabile]
MAIKHNQQIQKNHFHKDWQRYVRVHFDQAGKKKSRRDARAAKISKVAPRPVDKLRPVVRCPTVKYNRRVRPGRGFSLAELKAAGIPRKLAPTIGISVDPRRQNLSEESLKANVERLQEYRKKLILFPRRNGKTKSGDASAEDVKAAKKGDNTVTSTASVLPIVNKPVFEEASIGSVEATENAYRKLRDQRAEQRYAGAREKRAKVKAEEADAKKK